MVSASILPIRALIVIALGLGTIASPLESRTESLNLPCLLKLCTSGTICQVVDGKAQCVPETGIKCGPVKCLAGTYCCNASCGICAKPGFLCTQQACEPAGLKCGPNICAAGQECCNSSCGICVEPGGVCTEQLCLPAGPACGSSTCRSGYVCCNSSCGICTPPDGACTQQYCSPASVLQR
ncbi:hypothetical protein B0T19DRAFT_405661 [Cercophora scortea]|uniref:Uncharacterized protein n=1 Tax=Cercophora scortea TaxID=314031 RepID=A0AAE0J1D7_9PEZI|nr:hypothetical protein B0T19DRAFT_405661 [Cercophora scortea]